MLIDTGKQLSLPRWCAVVLLLLLLSAKAAAAARRLIDAGDEHSCAIISDGKLKCWGRNTYGQLGIESKADKGDQPEEMVDELSFVNLGTGCTAVSITLGSQHTCALLDNQGVSSVKCWGQGSADQLGLGDGQTRGDGYNEMGDALPTLFFGVDAEVIAVDAGSGGGCAVFGDHSVKCWWGGANGGLPYTVNLGSDFTAVDVSAGYSHMCALSDAGKVKCWYHNSHGELGSETTTSTNEGSNLDPFTINPVKLGTNRFAVAITTGFHHTCALLDNGGVKCWGLNSAGELGDASVDDRGKQPNDMGDNLPFVDLGTSRTAVAIDAGEYFTCALLDNGWLKCWGNNGNGRLGQGSPVSNLGRLPGQMGDNLPRIQLGSGRTVVAVATGRSHVMALLDDGSVKCWGANGYGRLGLGDTTDRGTAAGHMGDNLTAVALGPYVSPICPLGTYHSTSSTCEPCPANTWAVAQAASQDDCIPCPAGTYSTAQQASCKPIPTDKAQFHVAPPDNQYEFPVALRIDDEENDETYFFIDQFGRVGINTNVYDEAEEAFVVNGPARLKGDVFLDDDLGEEATLQRKLARLLEFNSCTPGTALLFLQNGRVQLHGQHDVCAVGSDLLCADVSLPTPMVNGSETILLTVYSLQTVVNGGGGGESVPAPVAWVGSLIADVADPDLVGGFVATVVPSTAGENDVVTELHWVVLGTPDLGM